METEKAFEELKSILVEAVSGINKQKQINKNLRTIEIILAIMISASIIVSWIASPVIKINSMNQRIRMLEYFMREKHPETKEAIPNPFQTRGAATTNSTADKNTTTTKNTTTNNVETLDIEYVPDDQNIAGGRIK